MTTRMGTGWSRTAACIAACLAATGEASAHVKWFCAYQIEQQPDHIRTVVNNDFVWLTAIAVLCLSAGTLIDETFAGRALNRSLVRLRSIIPVEGELFVRASCAFYLISVWLLGGIILTPELKTTSPLVPLIQLACAASLISKRTSFICGFALIGLYIYAAHGYGLFHLADYPIFLGVAVYLIAVAFGVSILGFRPIDVLRWSAAITLMWASVEKWAFPEWSYPLFIEHPAIGLGYTPEYYMRAAGVVEFTLAFALLGTPLVRFSSAIMLMAIFVAAIGSFGKVDAVGHAPIIGVLAAIALDDYSHERGHLATIAAVPIRYAIFLAMFVSAYYAAHALIYGTTFT